MDKQLVVSSDESTDVFHPSNEKETENTFLDNLECNEDANKKSRWPPTESEVQVPVENLVDPPLLGLQLTITPEFLKSVENAMNGSSDPSLRQPLSEKFKSSIISASYIRIGKWERTSRTKDDLVAKFYFGRKRILWEFLEEGLKTKIEMKLSDIVGIRAVMKGNNESGILEIELNNPPTFHEELDPQPRKHTIWKLRSDFTTGEASLHRIHHIRFPPESLDKHYEKLLKSEPRLLQLTKKPFPSLESPYFNQERCGAHIVNLGFQNNSFPSIPPTFVSPDHVASYQRTNQASFKETTSPASDKYQYRRNQIYEGPVLPDQGVSSNYTSGKLGMFPALPTHQHYGTTNHIMNQTYEDQSMPVLPGLGLSSNNIYMHHNFDTQQPFPQGSAQVFDYVLQPFDQVGMQNYEHMLQQMAGVAQLTGIPSEAYSADEKLNSELWGQADEKLNSDLWGQADENLNSDLRGQVDELQSTRNVLKSLGYPPPTPSDQSLQGQDSSFAPVASDASIQDFGHRDHFHGTNPRKLRDP